MRDNRLTQLLRNADDATDSSQITPEHIRAAARRRIARRRSLRFACILLFSVGAGFLAISLQRNSHPAPIIVQNPHDAPAPESVLAVRQRIADQAQAILDHRRVRAWVADIEPVDPQAAREEAARTIVLIAEQRAELVSKQETVELYHRAIVHFPETQWALLADRAIKQIEKSN